MPRPGDRKTLRGMLERLAAVKPLPKPLRVSVVAFEDPVGDCALWETDDGFLLYVQPTLPLPVLEERLMHEWAHMLDRCRKRPCGHRRKWGHRYADVYRAYHSTA